MAAKSVQGELDKLIDWYAKNKPDNQSAIRVDCPESSVADFAMLANDRWFYRGHEILPVGKSPGKKGQATKELKRKQQAIVDAFLKPQDY